MNSETARIFTEEGNRRRERFTAGDCARTILRCVGFYLSRCLKNMDYEVSDEEKLQSDPKYGLSMAALETDAISSDEKYVKMGTTIGMSREGIPIKIMD